MKRTIAVTIAALMLFCSLVSCTSSADVSSTDTTPLSSVTETEQAESTKKFPQIKPVVLPEEDVRMVETYIDKLRDPFVLEHNGKYYMYGTGWKCYVSMLSTMSGTWIPLGCVVETPEDAQKDYWAPEVYKYNGEFYMFTTYYSKTTKHRGCSVFKSSIPDGPFKEISNGHVTPADWDAIDGTLYIDGEGQPWMVFVHEWTSMPGSIGAMAAAKMSDDLTHFISEPIQLFLASDAPWARSGVTDGCFMYECENGELIMLWSSFDSHGYAVGIARSDNGKLDGNWTHDAEPLYSKKIYGGYDGGHPMVFTALNGHKYIAMHSPNSPDGTRKEKPVLIPFHEENGKIVLHIGNNQ
jgi:GH43 family beta-xylosidase